MPDPAVLSALAGAIQEVLERMFFVEATGAAEAGGAGADAVAVRLAFEGHPPGSLRVRVAPQPARSLAADFLGIDLGDISTAQVESVICELANMICGSVLSQLECGKTFHLGAPSGEPAEQPEDESGEAIRYTVEAGGGPLSVILKTEGPICPASEESAS